MLIENDYRKITDCKGALPYGIKECIDEFPYTYTDEKGKKHTVKLQEKRVVTYNPKLAGKKRDEINKMVEKSM